MGEERESGGHEALLERERRIARGGQQLLFSGGHVEGTQREQGKCPNHVLAKGYQGLTEVPEGWTSTLGSRQLGRTERVSLLLRAPKCARPYVPSLCPSLQSPAPRTEPPREGARPWLSRAHRGRAPDSPPTSTTSRETQTIPRKSRHLNHKD